MSSPLAMFLLGLLVGIIGVIAATVGGLAWAYHRSTRETRGGYEADLDDVLRRFAERGGEPYDAMCRDCGGIYEHRLGCPELDQAR